MKIFDVAVERGENTVSLVLSGELDIASSTKLESELSGIEAESPSSMIIDLRKLQFMDSTGLRTIIAADGRAKNEGREVAIVKGPETVQRVFEITGIADNLKLVDDPTELISS